jgi:hypothetical protein
MCWKKTEVKKEAPPAKGSFFMVLRRAVESTMQGFSGQGCSVPGVVV